MADPKDPSKSIDTDNIKDANKEMSLFSELFSEAVKYSAAVTINTRDLLTEMKDLLKIKVKINDYDKSLIDIGKKIIINAQQNNTELRRSGRLNTQFLNDRKALVDVERELAIIAQQNNFGLDQINELSGIADKVKEIDKERNSLLDKTLSLSTKIKTASEDEKNIIQDALNIANDNLAVLDQEYSSLMNSLDTDKKRYVYSVLMKQSLDDIIDRRKEELQLEDKINEAMGLTGAILDNVNKIGGRFFGGIGINLSVLSQGIKKAYDDAYDTAEKLIVDQENREGRTLSTFEKRVLVMRNASSGIRQAFFNALVDPLTLSVIIIEKIISGFNQVDKEATTLQRNIGRSVDTAASLNTEFASAVDYYKQINDLVEQTGLQADLIFDKDMIASAAELVNLTGMSNQEMSRLVTLTTVNKGNIDDTVKGIIQSTSEFNKSRRTAVSQGLVMKDIAKASLSLSASLKSNPQQLAEAAASARRLGIELSKLESIADSLLNFETSIESELEAQLLTGKDLNYNKARELALNNDIAGLSEEIFKNSAELLEYGNYNRIQQEAYANSLFMTRDELAKIAYQRGLELGLTDEAIQKASSLNEEEFKRMAVADSIAKSMEKLAQTFAPIIAFAAEYANIIIAVVGGYKVLTSLTKLGVLFSALRLNNELASNAALSNQIRQETILNTLKARGLATETATMVASVVQSPGKAILGLALAATAVAAVMAAMSKVQDAYIDNKGGLVVSGPKGMYQLDKDDSIIAGTDLESDPSKIKSSKSGMTSVTINTQKFDTYARDMAESNRELTKYMKELVEYSKKPASVNIDGNKAGLYIKMAETVTS